MNGTTYYVNVTSTDSAGNSMYNDSFSFTTAQNVAPVTPPVIVTPAGGGGGGAVFVVDEELKVREEVQRVLLGCDDGSPFMNRLFSQCKIPENEICDNGENFLVDDDCEVTLGDVRSGSVFRQMWLLRFLLILAVYFLVRDNESFPLIVSSLLLLFIYNGAFIPSGYEIEPGMCMDVNFFRNIGYCAMPHNLVAGWLLSIGMVALLISHFFIQEKKVKRKKSKKEWKKVQLVKPNHALIIALLVALVMYGGAFMEGAGRLGEGECLDVHFLLNFGSCVTPSNPLIGWVVGFAALALILTYFTMMGRKPKEKKPEKPKSI